MKNWAEQECKIACKKLNPNFNFDDPDAWDYDCSCYKSALKAYESLCEDGHSGLSWGFTKNILIRLMNNQPLTPITDEDFFSVKRGTEEYPEESDEWLKEQGLKSDLQCPRMSSLFRYEHLDGTITYHDIDRAYYVNIEHPSDTYNSSTKFLDEMFPITMPYMPKQEKYQIYAQSFLTNEKHGDFDVKGILYIITPEGEKIDINIFEAEGDDNKWKRITKEEYDELLNKRIDKLNKKVSSDIIWTLISNSGTDKEIDQKEDKWKNLSNEYKESVRNELDKMCEFFDNPEHYQYNTFSVYQALCKNNIEKFKDIPELVTISNFLNNIHNELLK